MSDAAQESPVTLEKYAAMDMEARREVWLQISKISRAELDAHMEKEKAREASVPSQAARRLISSPTCSEPIAGVPVSRCDCQNCEVNP